MRTSKKDYFNYITKAKVFRPVTYKRYPKQQGCFSTRNKPKF